MIPDYQTLMLPLLIALGDQQEQSMNTLTEKLAAKFNLSNVEKTQRIPSGQMTIIANRVGWAKTYLKKAGLLTSPKRGWVKIEDAGLKVLQSPPEKIDIAFLNQFESFRLFRMSAGSDENLEQNSDSLLNGKLQSKNFKETKSDILTPLEQFESAYSDLRQATADELLQRVMNSSPRFFEELVVKLLVKMGYGGNFADAAKAIGMTGDAGLDGIIKEDKLGLDVIYVQAKRWDTNCGRPEIQKFAGALLGMKARKGVFITTSGFSKDAINYVANLDAKIVLVDGKQLTEFMLDYTVGVAVEQVYTTYKIDEDFFV